MKYLISLLTIIHFNLLGQSVLITPGGTLESPNAQIVMESTSSGFQLQKVSSQERNLIQKPTPGLMVFDTDFNQIFVGDGATWLPMSFNSVTHNPLSTIGLPLRGTDTYYNEFYTITDIAIKGDEAFIGTPYRNQAFFDMGEVIKLKFTREHGWQDDGHIIPNNHQPDDYFGQKMGFSGEKLLVNTNGRRRPNPNINGAGCIIEFEKNAQGVWQQGQIVFPNTSYELEYWGQDFISNENHLIVNSKQRNLNESLQIFTRNGAGIWQETQAIQVPTNESSNLDFGASIALFQDYLIVGAPGYSSSGIAHGAAYLYHFEGGQFVYIHTILPPNLTISGNNFGLSVALSSNRIFVGIKKRVPNFTGGAVAVYDYAPTINPNLIQTIIPSFGKGYEGTNSFGIGHIILMGDHLQVSDIGRNVIETFKYDINQNLWFLKYISSSSNGASVLKASGQRIMYASDNFYGFSGIR